MYIFYSAFDWFSSSYREASVLWPFWAQVSRCNWTLFEEGLWAISVTPEDKVTGWSLSLLEPRQSSRSHTPLVWVFPHSESVSVASWHRCFKLLHLHYVFVFSSTCPVCGVAAKTDFQSIILVFTPNPCSHFIFYVWLLYLLCAIPKYHKSDFKVDSLHTKFTRVYK